MARPIYVPTVCEQVLTVDRPAAFAALRDVLGVDALEADALGATHQRTVGDVNVIETVISHEPPWRLVLDADQHLGVFHQESIVLVPHAAGCLAMWSALVDEPRDERTAGYADAVSAAVAGRLGTLVDRLG